jgi:hypothetical protein
VAAFAGIVKSENNKIAAVTEETLLAHELLMMFSNTFYQQNELFNMYLYVNKNTFSLLKTSQM